MMLVSAGDLIALYLGFELMSLSLYVMAAIMAVAAIVALLGLRHGVQEEPPAHERDVDDPAVEQATLA